MLRLVFPRVFTFAVPNGAVLAGNGGQRARQMGALLGDGLVKGCPDIVCLWNQGNATLEVKRPKTGRVSEDQKEIHGLLGRIGVPCKVITSLDEAYVFLREMGAPWSGIDPRLDKSDPLWGAHG
jgi:hypothetical protein